MVVDKERSYPPKMSATARFQGLWVVVVAWERWWVVVMAKERSYPPENEPLCSFSGVVDGGGCQ